MHVPCLPFIRYRRPATHTEEKLEAQHPSIQVKRFVHRIRRLQFIAVAIAAAPTARLIRLSKSAAPPSHTAQFPLDLPSAITFLMRWTQPPPSRSDPLLPLGHYRATGSMRGYIFTFREQPAPRPLYFQPGFGIIIPTTACAVGFVRSHLAFSEENGGLNWRWCNSPLCGRPLPFSSQSQVV